MLRKTVTALLLVSTFGMGPARGQDREWEEDYSGDQATAPAPGQSGYDVSVDVGVSGSLGFDTFYGSLLPYGEWVVAGSYGRVWRPQVAPGWRPYYYGRWEWTNEGWLWVTSEPFGWAVYHYGRWAYDPTWGWIWVPGYEWAPAWVTWRFGGDAVGWAPLGPGLSVYVTSYPFVDFWWTFVPTAQFVGVPVYSCAYAPVYTRRWFYATAPAPPRPAPAPYRGVARAPAWGGPAPRAVEERLGRPIVPVRVVPSTSPTAAPSRPGVVPIYRPDIRPAPGAGGRGGPVAAPGSGWEGGHGRGPGPVPAPGAGGRDDRPYPPAGGANGRGPGPAPAPGWDRRQERTPAPGWGGGPERAPVAGPGWNRRDERGGPAPQPSRGGGFAPAQAPRGGGFAPNQAPRGGGYAPAQAPRAGGYGPAPAPRGGSAPAPQQGGGGGTRHQPTRPQGDHR